MNSQSSSSKSEHKTNSKVNTTKQLPSDGSENEQDRSSVIEVEKKKKHLKKNASKDVNHNNVLLDLSKEQ